MTTQNRQKSNAENDKIKKYKVNISNDKAELYEKVVFLNSKLK